MNFYENPEYKANKERWMIQRDLFRGDHKTLCAADYLWMHEFEQNDIKGGGKLRATREERTRYVNLLRSILSRYVAILFHGDMDFSGVEAAFEPGEIDNVDGQKTALDAFIRTQMAVDYFLYGRVFILADAPNIEVRNRLEEQQLGMRPYLERIDPLSVVDWELETLIPARKGKLNFLRTEYKKLEPRKSASEEPQVNDYTTIYQADGSRYMVTTYRKRGSQSNVTDVAGATDWELVGDEVESSELNEIPISFAMRESAADPLVDPLLALYNAQSALDNQLNFQAYQRILASGQFKPGDAAVMNEGNITMFGEGYTFTIVEPSNPSALKDRIGELQSAVMQIAFSQRRVINASSALVESAETLKESMREFTANMVMAGKDIKLIADDAVRNFALFRGREVDEAGIGFDFDLNQESIEQQIALTNAFYSDIVRHPTWHKSTLKKVATQQNFSNLDEIIDEIDETPEPAPQTARVDTRAVIEEAIGANENPPATP